MKSEFKYEPDEDGPIIDESGMALAHRKLKEWEAKIDGMTQIELARLQRFAPSGHPVFDNRLPLYDRFRKRFGDMGGMTPEISKRIGW